MDKDNFFYKRRLWFLIVFLTYAVGIVIGALYAANVAQNTDKTLYEYLNGFLENIKTQNTHVRVFTNSLEDNFKLFSIIFICGFFKLGIIAILSSVAVKGFISGFTTAALVKYYGLNGLWLNLCSTVSVVIFVPTLIFFSVYAINFALSSHKKEKNLIPGFIVVSLICLTIFCVTSLADGYLTTTFMKILASKFGQI